jgi:hypothetical protein
MPSDRNTTLSGFIVGYDPGAEKAHGFALLSVEDGVIVRVTMDTLSSTEEVIRQIEQLPDFLALGIDTLTCWSTGPGGWRPADRWLRDRYPDVAQSVVAPNSLRGAMAVGGMALLMALCADRTVKPNITETHPKVLFRALHKDKLKYDYIEHREPMDKLLSRLLGVDVAPNNDHEWDAAISAFAALKGFSGQWPHDLHQLKARENERILEPCGATHYFWPE